jgi:phosphoribosylamine--glycine ligase
MITSCDHKRVFDNDEGLNTGGMGTFAPCPFYGEKTQKEVLENIMLPTMRAMNAEGRTFKGCLYFGLMITKNGPKVIEYNCRFGDPETQVVLPLLDTDLFEIMQAVEAERLSEIDVKFKDASACCVILASNGYPGKYATGFEITLPEAPKHDADIFCAGVKAVDGKIVTGGGRVLGVTAVAGDLKAAVANAYEAASEVKFENAYMRSDIGARALSAIKGE